MFVFLLVGLLFTQDLSLPGFPKYNDIVVEIRDRYAKELTRKYGMQIIATGGGFENQVYTTSLDFIIDRYTEIESAREKYIEIVETLLSRINNDKRMVRHLKGTKLTHENIDLVLSIRKPDYSVYWGNGLSAVFTEKNKIRYCYADSETKNEHKIFHEETYEEALAIIKKNREYYGLDK